MKMAILCSGKNNYLDAKKFLILLLSVIIKMDIYPF